MFYLKLRRTGFLSKSDQTTHAMFVIKLTDMYAPSSTSDGSNFNKLGSMASDLIVITPGSTSINFFVTYVMYPFLNGVNYKVNCVQFGLTGPKGEDMGKIPNQPMIDVVIPNLHIGSTIEKISSFLQKLIMVECGLHYQYDSHQILSDEYSDISRWTSIYSNVTKLISIHVHSLDEKLERRRNLMRMTQCLIGDTSTVYTGAPKAYPYPYPGTPADASLNFRGIRAQMDSPQQNHATGTGSLAPVVTSPFEYGDDWGRCVYPNRGTVLNDGGSGNGNTIPRDAGSNGDDGAYARHERGRNFVPPPPVPSPAW